MSITNNKLYRLKKSYPGKGISYDEYILKFGNNELLVHASTMQFSVIFGKQYLHFDTGRDTIDEFIGQKKDEGKYLRL